jgi:translation initiation factor RLI1
MFTNVSNVNSQVGCDDCLVIFVSTELPDFYNKLLKEKEIKLEKKFQKRNVWIKIYKYKKN